jgi:hypothetical protein
VRSKIPSAPVEPVHEGATGEAVTSVTGHASFEVEHSAPVRIRLETVGARAFVLVVQPS